MLDFCHIHKQQGILAPYFVYQTRVHPVKFARTLQMCIPSLDSLLKQSSQGFDRICEVFLQAKSVGM